MKTYRQDISYVLDIYTPDLGDEKAHYLADKICELYACSKTLINMPNKLISLFNEVAHYDISKKLARKIVYDITCQSQLSELFEELLSSDIIKDKLFIDRKEYSITLKVHDDFIVKSYINTCKTYINGKFYYDIEEQDLLECYCDFVTDNCIYVLYKTPRPLSFIGLAERYLKTLSDKTKIQKLKNNKSVYMIFTNTELIYKAL